MAQGPQNSKGIPPGLKFYSPYPFAGMNTQASPTSISDQEFTWLENFIRVGDGKLRTLYDIGVPLFKSSGNKAIVSFFSYTLGTNYYFAVFLSDGSALQVAWPSGGVAIIGGAGTFFKGSGTSLPGCSQWGVQYLLIGNRNSVNDYWIWDGALLYTSGTVAPGGAEIISNGSNYASSPTATVYGGFGAGVVLQPVVNAGGVVELVVTNPGSGYEVGDQPQIAFSGGGSDSSAILTANVNTTGIAAANITNPGSGYTTATVAFSGGGGSGAAATAQIGAGVASVAVTNGGSGYTGANVTFTGGAGTGATAVADVNGGVIISITVTNPGTGYTSAPTVGITGDGFSGAATASVNSGLIVGITITVPGSGYTSAPAIAISGDGSSATATAILRSGSVQSVTVTNPGSGFFQPPAISFVGGGSPTAIATGVVDLTGTSVAKINVLATGSGYGSHSGNAPGVTILGGGGAGGTGGTGATATVSAMSNGSILSINLTNGGSNFHTLPVIGFSQAKGDAGSGAVAQGVLQPTTINQVFMSSYGANYTQSPAIVVSPGSNNAAYASLSLMPFGLSGTALETFQRRVWIADPAQGLFETTPPQGNFAVTAPESLTDVATSDGGVLFTNTDAFLQTQYVAIKQSNGYLYFIGDGSVSVVSGVQTVGNPVTTSFNYQTVDPQIGGAWRDAIQDFGRNILIANPTGIYNIVGGSLAKVSDKMDNVFLNGSFPPSPGALVPSGAVAHIFNVKHYLMLATVTDPDLGAQRNVMLTWNGREWSITSQSVPLTYIATQKRASQLYAWGTDGMSLYPLFAKPSDALVKRIDTKLFGANNPIVSKNIMGFYMQAQDQTVTEDGVSVSLAFDVSGNATQVPNFESIPSEVYTAESFTAPEIVDLVVANPTYPAPFPTWPIFGTATAGIPAFNCGVRLSTTSPDFILSHLLLAYTEEAAMA